MSKFLKLTASVSTAFALSAGAVYAEGGKLGLGRVATSEEVAAWDIDIRPDGQGLPEGRGNAYDGEEIFADKCAVCHGDFGEAVGRWPILAGGQDTLDTEDPVKSVGSYWPYLSTVWDYINRAMPFGYAQSLTPDEVYAITAYILYVNDLVEEEDFELNHENFASFRLPNEDNFFMDDRDETEYPVFAGEVCMENCKPSVEITAKAAVVDVTPDDKAARERREAAAAAVAAQEAETPNEAAPAATEETEAEEATQDAEAEEETAAVVIDPKLVKAGEKVFKKCKACHKVGDKAKNASGPMLNGILGRQAGTVEGFRYSKAMAAAGEDGLVWTPEELGAFLAKPKTYLKGTKMSFSGLKKEKDVDAIIAYLGTFAE